MAARELLTAGAIAASAAGGFVVAATGIGRGAYWAIGAAIGTACMGDGAPIGEAIPIEATGAMGSIGLGPLGCAAP